MDGDGGGERRAEGASAGVEQLDGEMEVGAVDEIIADADGEIRGVLAGGEVERALRDGVTAGETAAAEGGAIEG